MLMHHCAVLPWDATIAAYARSAEYSTGFVPGFAECSTDFMPPSCCADLGRQDCCFQQLLHTPGLCQGLQVIQALWCYLKCVLK